MLHVAPAEAARAARPNRTLNKRLIVFQPLSVFSSPYRSTGRHKTASLGLSFAHCLIAIAVGSKIKPILEEAITLFDGPMV